MIRRIHPAAYKHGIADESIHHAIDNAIVISRYDDRLLYLGSDLTSTMLEVISIVDPDGPELVIHAMPMRDKYLPLLRGLGESDA